MSSIAKTMTVHDFEAVDIRGESVKLDKFKGDVLLVVNTASACGFTPQYEGLQALYDQYNDQGFQVLGFPCNQFGGQERGSEQDIIDGCMTQFGVTFPMFSKVNVNGQNAHPLFQYLKSELPGLLGGRIKWNFTKFLIDKDGNPIKRYAPKTTPREIEKDILKLL